MNFEGNYGFYLPAAGRGSRLNPLTVETPKSMLPVIYNENRVDRIIDYSLYLAIHHDLPAIVTGYHLAEKIEVYLQEQKGIKFFRDSGLIHIGGSIRQHLQAVSQMNVQRLVVVPTDNYIRPEILFNWLTEIENAPESVSLLATPDTENHDSFTVNNLNYYAPEPHKLDSYSSIGNLGIYAFKTDWILSRLDNLVPDETGHLDLMTDVVFGEYANDSLIPIIRFYPINKKNNWQDLGTFTRLYEHILNSNQVDARGNVTFPGAFINPSAQVSNSILYPGAVVDGRTTISKAIIDSNTLVNETTVGYRLDNSPQNPITIYSRNYYEP